MKARGIREHCKGPACKRIRAETQKRRIWEFRYPRLCNWLIFSRLADGRWDVFDDAREKHFLLDGRTVRYIRRLDGKRNPFCISRSFSSDEVKAILRFLLENHLLRRGRIRRLSSGFLGFSVWIPSRGIGRNRGIFRCLNLLLLLSFLPVFGLGIWMNLRGPSVSPGLNIFGVLFGNHRQHGSSRIRPRRRVPGIRRATV